MQLNHSLRSLIERLPKAELHLHLEGSLEPDLMMAIAKRNGASIPYSCAEEVKKAYEFNCLQDFLDIYHQATSVIRTEQDFYDITMAYLKKAHEDLVVHTEIFIDVQSHQMHGISAYTVISGVHRACEDARRSLGITSALIMAILRHLSEESALEMLETIKPFREKVIGIGLASSEKNNPPSKFKRAFALAKQQGYRLVAHAGEEGDAANIWSAIHDLQVERIDHGVMSIQDPALIRYLVEHQIPLTVCPFSNVKLCVVPDLERHMLKDLLRAGVKVTINSDDPAYFGGYVNDNFIHTVAALNMSANDAIQLAINSIESSFMPSDLKRKYLERIADTVG